MERPIILKWTNVSLGVFEKGDIEVAYKWMNNLELIKYSSRIKTITREAEEEYFSKMKDRPHDFVIILNITNEVMGWLGLIEYNEFDRNGTIWIMMYSDNYTWKGFWTEAMRLYLKYCFEYLWLHKVKLHFKSFNERAKRLYVKSWFKEVARFKEDIYHLWKYYDMVWMELFKTEYDEIKKGWN